MISERKWLNTFLTCLFGGIFGLHRFYVGKIKEAIIAIVITAVGFVLIGVSAAINAGNGAHDAVLALMIVGTIFVLVAAVWEIVDLIMICCHKYKDSNGNFISDDINQKTI